MIPMPLEPRSIPCRPNPRPPRPRTTARRVAPRHLMVALVAYAVAAGASAATACGTLSPTLATLGTDYLLLEEGARFATDELVPLDRPLADRRDPRRADARRLARLLKTLETATLDGIDGERVRCHGTGDALREVRWRFALEQLERVETANGQIVLTAVEARHAVSLDARGDAYGDDRRVDGTLATEVIDLPAGDAWRPSTDGTWLRAERRFRRAGAAASCPLAAGPVRVPAGASLAGDDLAGAASCSYLTEIDTRARMAGGSIEIEQVFYVGGRLSERVLWRLGT